MTSPSRPANKLATESSLYLRQHATNPVDWYPWGDEAFEAARRLDRPILLSVGYSACHWCHVMERESFEDEAIAAQMNAGFVCIKVDREERPDVDQLYMKALQGMTGRGGWPMTVFLTPSGEPFHAGTYFPPEDRGGMPGLPRVLAGVARVWAERRADVLESGRSMVEFLSRPPGDGSSEATASAGSFAQAAADLVASMDGEHGGFGRAPKFPATMALGLLMEAEVLAPDEQRRRLLRLTLESMAAGGMRDHLGGGFHRYSVDREWLVPHFEKMLYDQALMASLYTDAARFLGDRAYAEVAAGTLDYVLREMTSPEGTFYAAQDADSEGEEGRYFVWDEAEIEAVLGPDLARTFGKAYGVTARGNFEGRNILHRRPGEAARAEDAHLEEELAGCRRRLLEARRLRVAPATDTKVAVDWNALVASALVSAGRWPGREDYLDAAEKAVAVILASADTSGRLPHLVGGSRRIDGFLDDYAFLGCACLDLFEARPRQRHFDAAVASAERLLAEFAHEGGGFCFTSSSGPGLVARGSDLHDGAVPSGNTAAAELLLWLWVLTGEERYRAAAEGVFSRFLEAAGRHPYGAARLLSVAERHRRGLRLVVVGGERKAALDLFAAARSAYDPGTRVLLLAGDEEWLPPALRGKEAGSGGAAAWICEGTSCGLPLRSADEVKARLARDGRGS